MRVGETQPRKGAGEAKDQGQVADHPGITSQLRRLLLHSMRLDRKIGELRAQEGIY